MRLPLILIGVLLISGDLPALAGQKPPVATSPFTITPSPISQDMTVVAWVRGDTISLSTSANSFLVSNLNGSQQTCSAVLARWAQGTRAFILDDTTDVPYADNWLLIHSANPPPPNTLDQAALQASGKYRMFNRFKTEFKVQNGTLSGIPFFHQSAAVVGSTPDPCSGVIVPGLSDPEVAVNNGFKGPTRALTEIVQITQGRLGSEGQAINTTLNNPGGTNGANTPWIWSMLRFNLQADLSSNFSVQCSPVSSADRQIFPTYSIYTGNKLTDFEQQCDPSSFLTLDQSSRVATP